MQTFWMTCFGLGFGRGGVARKKKERKPKKQKKTCIGEPSPLPPSQSRYPKTCFFCFFLFFFQIADSRWLTSQWNSQCKRKKVGPGGWGKHIIYIYIYICIHYTYVYIICIYQPAKIDSYRVILPSGYLTVCHGKSPFLRTVNHLFLCAMA